MPLLTLDQILANLAAINTEVKTTFGAMANEPLNWKPAPAEWSIGQCLEHLIITNRAYFPELERIIRGDPSPNIWLRAPLLPDLFGWLLKKSMAPNSPAKMKAPKLIEPSTSQLPVTLVADFAATQRQVSALIQATAPLNWAKTRITSPLAGEVITYSLQDCFEIFVLHEKLHVNQAKRVMATPGFPGI